MVMTSTAYQRTLARFWAKAQVSPDFDDCWQWTACERAKGRGYGAFRAFGKQRLAHRFAYEVFVGKIPRGLQIDHLCRNRGCVNPTHMEPVTLAQNVLRGDGITAVNARKTHCKRGHLFDADNTYARPDGDRDCRACRALHGANRGQRG